MRGGLEIVKQAVSAFVGGLVELMGECSAMTDVNRIKERKDIDATTKKRLIDARLGQGRFRTDVWNAWNNRCAVTKSATEAAIRASHIKPWRDSNDDERLDPNNGLPLIATLDALFDRGLISFDSSGKLIVSRQLSRSEQEILGIRENSCLQGPLSEEQKQYLAYHRNNRFRP
jgi:putative restriction endonuclease